MIKICNICGTAFDSQDDIICPQCGSVSISDEREDE